MRLILEFPQAHPPALTLITICLFLLHLFPSPLLPTFWISVNFRWILQNMLLNNKSSLFSINTVLFINKYKNNVTIKRKRDDMKEQDIQFHWNGTRFQMQMLNSLPFKKNQGRDRDRDYLSSAGSFPECLQQPQLGRAKARSMTFQVTESLLAASLSVN